MILECIIGSTGMEHNCQLSKIIFKQSKLMSLSCQIERVTLTSAPFNWDGRFYLTFCKCNPSCSHKWRGHNEGTLHCFGCFMKCKTHNSDCKQKPFTFAGLTGEKSHSSDRLLKTTEVSPTDCRSVDPKMSTDRQRKKKEKC